MTYRRILLLHSYAEQIDSRRRLIASDATLDEVEFFHVAIIDLERGSKLVADLSGLTAAEFKTLRPEIIREVEPLLLKRIEANGPDLLLVHGGTLFRVETGEVLAMLVNVHHLHPDLPMALQGRDEWLDRAQRLMDHPSDRATNDRATVLKQMELISDLFVEDDEIRAVISATFPN